MSRQKTWRNEEDLIEAGLEVRFEGPTLIKGNVGKGANIEVVGGPLVILGNVEEGAKVNLKAAKNGCRKILDLTDKFSLSTDRLIVQGHVEAHAKLFSIGVIRIHGKYVDSGTSLKAKVILAPDLATSVFMHANHARTGNLGEHAVAYIENRILCQRVSSGAVVTAKNYVKCDYIDTLASVSAGRGIVGQVASSDNETYRPMVEKYAFGLSDEFGKAFADAKRVLSALDAKKQELVDCINSQRETPEPVRYGMQLHLTM